MAQSEKAQNLAEPAHPNPLAELKSWDKSIEVQIFQKWEKDGIGRFNVDSSKPLFVIDTPPPYPSGRPWHVGGASHYSEIDMIARSARMRGFEVLFPLGLDRNGLPVELYTEKKYGVSIKTTPREKFLQLCKVALDDLEQEMLQTFKLMGLSGNYEQKYRTDEEPYRALTQSTFISQWKAGRIYEGTRPSNYCIDCGTTIADAEIIYDELPTKFAFFKFRIRGEKDSFIPIASTRSELICSCQAVIVNPEDERYKPLIGKTALVPIYNREVPIVGHNSARPEFGTGALMVCSYGDYHDVQLFRELNLKEIIAIGDSGRMLPIAGKELEGLRIKQARTKMIELLQASGVLDKVEEIQHRTPLCERSRTPIEIIPMDEYYLRVVDVKPKLEQIAKSLKFHPEMHRGILLNWIEVALDWPISRRRFYGTEVPVWHCIKCEEPYLPPPGPYYQPWRNPPPPGAKCACGSIEFKGDVRTFDTWMDSSISALYITKYARDQSFHEKTYPTMIRPQGKDIIRTWLHYSILRCYQITGKVPWEHVWVTGWGLDEKGERMSKSKGNVIDPILMLNRYGAENFRLWIASEVSVGSDYTCSEQKIASPGKFLTKIWNISRFIAGFENPAREPDYEDLSPSDRWILAELSRLAEECLAGYEDYNFFIPANKIRDFTWNVFAAHYVELAKGRAYGTGFNDKEIMSARFTLRECLKTILLLLAPICPFITEALWLKIYSDQSIHKQMFPDPRKWSQEYLKHEKTILDFNSLVWNEKKARGLSLKGSVQIPIPSELEAFAMDLKTMHNLTIG